MKHPLQQSILEILAFIAIFLTDLEAALWALGFLIFTDTVLGIWAAYKKGGWKAITSRKLGRIITKLVLYPLAIIVAKVAEQYLAPSIPWIDITAGIVAIVEVKSIFEKIGMLLGFDLWAKVKKAIWKDKEIDVEEDAGKTTKD